MLSAKDFGRALFSYLAAAWQKRESTVSELDMFSLSASEDEDGIQSLMKIQMFGWSII
jgi:hypothetical protein